MEWYNKSAEDVVREQNADVQHGLTRTNAAHRMERYGDNALPVKGNVGMLQRVGRACTDAMVLTSLLALLVALLCRNWLLAALFLVLAALRAAVSVRQELLQDAGENGVRMLRPEEARVLRESRPVMVPTRELVPGDVVLLEAGDLVPADLRLISTVGLQLDESILTGDQTAVSKDAGVVLEGEQPIEARVNMAFAGSCVVYGRGRGVVVGTGVHTELGGVSFENALPERDRTAEQVARGVGIFCLAGWVILLVTGLIRAENPAEETLPRLASFAAAALPGGLTLALAACQSMHLQRMKKLGVIVRRLSSLGRLGTVNVICADKTGTFTSGEMVATTLWTGGKLTMVEGSGYNPTGKFLDRSGEAINPMQRKDLIMTLTAAALCNNAAIEESAIDSWAAVGEPTESALITLSTKAGMKKSVLDEAFPRLAEIPFDAERRMMTTIHRGHKSPIGYTKGAPEAVLARCTMVQNGRDVQPMTDELRAQLAQIDRLFSDKAMRVLAIATREYVNMPAGKDHTELEKDLTFLGLIGLADPVREGTKEAVQRARKAGVRTLLMTGESVQTAAALADAAGMGGEDTVVITGDQLDAMREDEVRETAKTARVYARVTPAHRERVLRALHKNGDIVAMTGDSVSDVGVMRDADIAVGKGVRGTEIARSSADIVVKNDSLAGIVTAIESGRLLFDGQRRVLRYLLSAGIAGGLTSLLCAFWGLSQPYTAVYALLCALVLFVIPVFFMGTGRGKDAVRRSSRNAALPLLNRGLLLMTAVQGVLLAVGGIILANAAYELTPVGESVSAYLRSLTTTLLVYGTLLGALSCRSERTAMWKDIPGLVRQGVVSLVCMAVHTLILYIRPAAALFGMSALGGLHVLLVLGIALVCVALTEIFKLVCMPMLLAALPSLERSARPEKIRAPKAKKKREHIPRFAGSDPTQEDEEDLVIRDEYDAAREDEEAVEPPMPLVEEKVPEEEELQPMQEISEDDVREIMESVANDETDDVSDEAADEEDETDRIR